jgi:hypothetical protein
MHPAAEIIWDKTNIVKPPPLPLSSTLPGLEAVSRQLYLGLLMSRARPFAFVVSAEEKDDPVTVRVTEDPQEDLRRLGGFRARPLSLSRQHLRGILVQPEFEDPATERFAEVGADYMRPLVLENLEHRDANRAALSRSKPAKPLENRLVPLLVLIELQRK